MDSLAVETQKLRQVSVQNGAFHELFEVASVVAFAVTQKLGELLHTIDDGGLLARRLQAKKQLVKPFIGVQHIRGLVLRKQFF